MSPEPKNNPPRPGAAEVAFIGMGSNLGDRRKMFRRALEMIGRLPQTKVVALSPLYYTDPADGIGGGEFLNGIARLATKLAPLELWRSLQEIEISLARKDKGKNRPRTIDLDLLLHGRRVLNSPALVIPHPRMTERAFILRPFLDLAPDAVVPPLNLTVAQLWRRLPDQSGVQPATDIEITEILPHVPTGEGQR